jgi:hypothetical protein
MNYQAKMERKREGKNSLAGYVVHPKAANSWHAAFLPSTFYYQLSIVAALCSGHRRRQRLACVAEVGRRLMERAGQRGDSAAKKYDRKAMKIPRNRLIGTLFVSALLVLAVRRIQAQLPFRLPTSMVLETVTESNLLQQYPDRPELSNNVTEIKKYLSSDSPYSMRLSTSTETAISRQMAVQQIKQFGAANTNLHFHINFSSTQFLVEELNCPPNSYPLNVWQPVNNEAKIRSDGFFDGKYFVMMPGGKLSEMEFGNLDAFKKACIDAMQNPQPPSTHNGLLEQACVDFRQFARFQNLGHEGIVPNSFTFSGNDFVCLGVRGDHISGSIHANAAGLVDEISYKSSEHYGPRVFLLFYETLFTNCTWYPSRIVDATKQGEDRYAVRQIHTVYNVYAEEKGALAIPNTTAELYGTNVARQFEWSNNMAYEAIGTQLVARPTLVERHSEISPRARNLFGAFFIGFTLISLVAIIYFSRKNKNK